MKNITPSQLPFDVFALCAPLHVDTGIANNIWMEELSKKDRGLDKEKFIGQWFNFYNVLAANSLVYLIPSKEGLQDQTYVNCAIYMPHIKEEDTIVLGKFTARGRQGEEEVAGRLFQEMGYKVVQCPYKLEGEAELKYSGKDNIYYGGYGIRSDIKAHEWLEEKLGAKVIKLREKDPYLYHLDCNLFVISKNDIILNTGAFSKKTIKEIEKITNIHSVGEDEAYQGICNSLRVGDMLCNASSLAYMKSTDKYYMEEVRKNAELEKICDKVGIELMYFDMSEAWKSGALLSCFCMHLNHRNMDY